MYNAISRLCKFSVAWNVYTSSTVTNHSLYHIVVKYYMHAHTHTRPLTHTHTHIHAIDLVPFYMGMNTTADNRAAGLT